MIKCLLLLFILITNITPNCFASLTVLDIYEQAKKNHYGFKRTSLEKELVEQKLNEHWSEFFPKLSIESTSFYGNETLANKKGFNRLDHQQNMNLTWNLYKGGTTFAYFDYKKILPMLAISKVENYKLKHFLEINTLFFKLMSDLNRKKKIVKQIGTIEKQVALLKKRYEIGRSRKAEYLATLTSLKKHEVKLIQVEEMIRSQTIQLEELVGTPVRTRFLTINFKQFDFLPDKLNQDHLINFQFRPDYKYLTSQIGHQQILEDIASSYHWPDIALESNTYFNRRQFGRQDEWDISLNFTWKIIDFGFVSAKVQQERIKTKMLTMQKHELKNRLSQMWKQLRTQYLASQSTKEKLQEAYQISKENYKEHLIEFKNGLTNNIEVMKSLDDLIESELQRDEIRYSLGWNWYAMQAFLGNISL